MSKRKDGCTCQEQLNFELTQFKIIALVGLTLGVLAALFIADPGARGH